MTTAAVTAYPLCWPVGWPRARSRTARCSLKTLSFAWARDKLDAEVSRLGGSSAVLSTNVPLNLSGQPRGDFRDVLSDPGAALYFILRGRQMVMATDHFSKVSSNLHRLAMSIAYLRGLERHGGGTMLERAFAGFAALPDPNRVKPWQQVLAIEPGVAVTADLVEARFKAMARLHHPDVGGSETLMAEINAARDQGLRELAAAGAA